MATQVTITNVPRTYSLETFEKLMDELLSPHAIAVNDLHLQNASSTDPEIDVASSADSNSKPCKKRVSVRHGLLTFLDAAQARAAVDVLCGKMMAAAITAERQWEAPRGIWFNEHGQELDQKKWKKVGYRWETDSEPSEARREAWREESVAASELSAGEGTWIDEFGETYTGKKPNGKREIEGLVCVV